jgi:hypothetical protein
MSKTIVGNVAEFLDKGRYILPCNGGWYQAKSKTVWYSSVI